MIIKEADDKKPQLATLQSLLARPDCTPDIRKRIEQELRNIQAGIRGEDEAAYEMKVHYGQSQNWMVLHDLRVEYGDLVAQIDHLIINRWLEIWVCESKHFSEGIAINEHGEFSAFYGNRPYGVPSPIEQNNKHILILRRVFDSGEVKLPTRLGFTIKPDLKGLVLVSKGARISRPRAKVPGIECIIKNDQLFKTIDKAVDDSSPLVMAKIIGQDTLEDVARRVAKLHRPITFNWAAKFGLPESPPTQTAPSAPSQPVVPEGEKSVDTSASEPQKPKQKLVCHSCGEGVSYAVAKFCWFNKPRFGGNIFCMECQKEIQPL